MEFFDCRIICSGFTIDGQGLQHDNLHNLAPRRDFCCVDNLVFIRQREFRSLSLRHGTERVAARVLSDWPDRYVRVIWPHRHLGFRCRVVPHHHVVVTARVLRHRKPRTSPQRQFNGNPRRHGYASTRQLCYFRDQRCWCVRVRDTDALRLAHKESGCHELGYAELQHLADSADFCNEVGQRQRRRQQQQQQKQQQQQRSHRDILADTES